MDSLDLFIRTYGYPAMLGGMVLEQSVPPMPGEPILLGAGALAGNGRLSLWVAAALALAGTVVGDLVWYEIGRIGGQRVLKWMCRLAIEPDTCVRNGAETLTSHGASALLIAKFVPGLNSIGQPLAGALGMPRRRFMMFDALGAVLCVGTLRRSWLRLPRSAGRGRSTRRPPGRPGPRDRRRRLRALPG